MLSTEKERDQAKARAEPLVYSVDRVWNAWGRQ